MAIGFLIAMVDANFRLFVKKYIIRSGVIEGNTNAPAAAAAEETDTNANACPQDCNAVQSLVKKMNDAISDSMKLKELLNRNQTKIAEQDNIIKSLEDGMEQMRAQNKK